MAGIFEVKVDQKKLRRIERLLAGIPRALPKVVSRAINKTAAHARSRIVKEIASMVGFKQKLIRQQVFFSKASYRFWQSTIYCGKWDRIPLIDLDARQTSKGVSYKKTTGRELIPGAFIASMKSGHTGVFVRTAAKTSSKTFTSQQIAAIRANSKQPQQGRLPIFERYGPSIARVWQDAEPARQRIQQDAYTNLEQNLDAQVEVILKRGY